MEPLVNVTNSDSQLLTYIDGDTIFFKFILKNIPNELL